MMRGRSMVVLVAGLLLVVAQSASAFSFCPLGSKSSPRPRPPVAAMPQPPIYVLTPQGMLLPLPPRPWRRSEPRLSVWPGPLVGSRLGHR